MSNTTITINVKSAGFSTGNSALITWNDTEFGFDKYSRGLNVAVIHEATGQKLCCTTFDTYAPRPSEAFVQFVENLPEGRIVAIAVKDDASLNLSGQAKEACKSLGSLQVYCLRFQGSWAMIGQKGSKPRTATEELSHYCAVICSRSISLPSVSANGSTIAVTSAGSDHGNRAQITCNGEVVEFEGGYQRGLNVWVFEQSNGMPWMSRSFDLFADPANADAFAQLIEELPAGCGVAIGVKDDAFFNLSERAKQACEAIGSCLIHHLQFRSSWAIVGYKGASPGSAVEHLSHEESAFVRVWLVAPL